MCLMAMSCETEIPLVDAPPDLSSYKPLFEKQTVTFDIREYQLSSTDWKQDDPELKYCKTGCKIAFSRTLIFKRGADTSVNGTDFVIFNVEVKSNGKPLRSQKLLGRITENKVEFISADKSGTRAYMLKNAITSESSADSSEFFHSMTSLVAPFGKGQWENKVGDFTFHREFDPNGGLVELHYNGRIEKSYTVLETVFFKGAKISNGWNLYGASGMLFGVQIWDRVGFTGGDGSGLPYTQLVRTVRLQ